MLTALMQIRIGYVVMNGITGRAILKNIPLLNDTEFILTVFNFVVNNCITVIAFY